MSLKKRITRKKQPVKTVKNKKSYWPVFTLFIGAIVVGASLFFIQHPPSQYYFHNPFKALKTIKNKIVSRLFSFDSFSENHSIDYDEYKALSQNISFANKTRIQAFLNQNEDSPLAVTLRNNWLLFLAKQNNWPIFLENYQPTNNQSVECYHLQALYNTGKQTLAVSGVKRLWIAGYKHSEACNEIFSKWQNSENFREEYLWPRIQLAIVQQDLASIQQLITSLSPEKKTWVTQWLAIYKTPSLLLKTTLPNNMLGRKIIIDGLKQWASIDVHQAIQYWNKIQNQYQFDEAESQDFYLAASLHLALNGDSLAEAWFAKILPQYNNAQSRAWEVRFALMHQNWPNVLSLIEAMPENEQKSNIWRYWKARALAATGNLSAAKTEYQHLSSQRQYYGFLSAFQANQALSIQQVNYPQNNTVLAPYTQQIAQIQQLYQANQLTQALPLTQDILNQLDAPGKYTLSNLFAEWGWYSESMNIVNKLPSYQSDLKLRFPMPHRSLITELCAETNILPALVYAIARQESNFHEDVFSSAGGLGILQLTLSTAKQFDSHITKQALYDPKINIKISITYLEKLTKQFNEHPLLVISAYNAGPQKTRYWQPKSQSIPADIWIETRPWEETRNYLKNILSYYAVYQYLLEQTPNIAPFMQDIPPIE